jgi:hypothetical protein
MLLKQYQHDNNVQTLFLQAMHDTFDFEDTLKSIKPQSEQVLTQLQYLTNPVSVASR